MTPRATNLPNMMFAILALLLTTLCTAQTLQKGVSVQMAATNNAQPMPAADNQGAWIITVTDDGTLFFGANAVTRASLLDEMIRTPRNRNQMLYIKADARAPFSKVEDALKAGRTVMFQSAALLTAQPKSPEPQPIEPPNGLQVEIGSGTASAPKAAVLEIVNSNGDIPTLKVNGKDVSWQNLSSKLEQIFLNHAERQVQVKADSSLPFEQVARAIDACEATGAQVTLAPSAQL